MGHDHPHKHNSTKNLKIAFFLNLVFTIFEIIGGFWTNSVAILSDAVHDLGDSLSIGTAWYLQHKSNKKPDSEFSYGYDRFSLLGAAITALVLLLGSVYIINEAIVRLLHPEETNALGMIFFALVGVGVNGYAAWKLSKGDTLNERVVSWHLIEDALGWIAVLIVAIVLFFKDVPFLDPALSIGITIYILWNALKKLKETVMIFLQNVPKDIDTREIEGKILAVPHVQSVHNMHVWSLDGVHHVFSAHVKLHRIESIAEYHQVKQKLKDEIMVYAFKDCTIEVELDEENSSIAHAADH